MSVILPETPSEQAVWWLHKLEGELALRQGDMRKLDDYYRGEHPLPFITPAHAEKIRNEFRMLLDESRSNFMRLVVDAVEERLRVDGFRLSAATDSQSDAATWEIWQANQMDAESQTAFLESLVKGVSYLSIWKTDADEHPSIAIEDPMQTIIGYEPGSNFRQRAAALKIWLDDWTGRERANVYLPSGIYKFERAVGSGSSGYTTDSGALNSSYGQKVSGGARGMGQSVARSSWVELPDQFVENPIGVVPIVPLRNRPRLLVEGESEIADVYRIQNQINGFLFLLALAGYFGAHRQRWMAGVSLEKDDSGRDIEPFRTAIDRLWYSENPDARFGDFEQTDLSGYIRAIEQKVLHIAVTTRTPRHYLIQEGQSPSGDAIKSAESGLIKKVVRKMRPFGEGLEEAMRLARAFAGEPDAPVDSEIVWADPEIRSEAEITDAAIKRFQAGLVTWEQTLEDLGYTQTQIARMSAERKETLEAELDPQRQAVASLAASLEEIRAELMAAVREAREETIDLRAVVTELGTREPPPPPNITVHPPQVTVEPPAVNFNEGAIQANITEGAIQNTVNTPAVTVQPPQVTVEPASVTVEAPPVPDVTVNVPDSRPRSATVKREDDGTLAVTYDQES
jgi:hypothetical protein